MSSIPRYLMTFQPQPGQIPVLNVAAPQVIAPAATWLIAAYVVTPPTDGDGALILNDCATLEEAGSNNQINAISSTLLISSGLCFNYWPLLTGLVVSQIPDGGVFHFVYA